MFILKFHVISNYLTVSHDGLSLKLELAVLGVD
eukprot:COSAG02_NODE_62041_length_267_cov_0.601190_1_plen_32_part_01